MDEEDARVYEKHAEELVSFACALAGPSEAEDILSAAILRVFSSPKWKEVTNKRAYLYRAVVNEALQSRRAIARRLRREIAAANSDSVHDSYHDAELLDALRRLTVRMRAVVYLTYWVGLNANEIAQALNVSPRTVQRELLRARGRLEVLLK